MPKYLDETGVRKLWAKTKEKAGDAERNAVATAGNYSVNGHKINTNPTLTKTDVGLGNVTNDAQIPLSQKGVAGGVATLGTDGKVPSAQLPSYVDDVLEFNGKSTFPATGETGKIYVDTSTNKTYRWSGTTYTEISASLALGETSSTAYAGDKGKTLATKVSTLESTVATKSELGKYVGGANANSLVITPASEYIDVLLSNADKSINTSTEINAATTSDAGVMSAADKTKLDGIAAGANAYSHPAGSAASKAVGFYKISTDAQSHVASVVNVTKDDITKLGIPAQDTTYSVATTSANGLMSAADKELLDYYDYNRGSYLQVNSTGNLKYKESEVDLGSVCPGPLDDFETNWVILKAATSTQAGVMSAADKTKLDGIVALTDTEIDAILV